jgi:geranylgeranyl reductase family protein
MQDTTLHAYDAAVVGGGPAGAAAAYELAAAGARVVLLERETLPRYKTCGGGVVRAALPFLPAGAALPFERSFMHVALHMPDAGLHHEVSDKEAIVHAGMRADLDAALVDAAVQRGAELRAPCRCTGVDPDARGITLRTDAGDVRARCVIAADGAASRIAAWSGWEPIEVCAPALEWEIEVDATAMTEFGATLRFDFGSVPGGYGWVFPKRAHLSVGAVRVAPGGEPLPRSMERYLAQLGLRGIRRIDKHGAWIPLRPRSGGASRGRVFLAGDAAGVADPLLCEGIRFALRSGRLAARALHRNDFDPGRAAEDYAASLATDILPELRWARRLAGLLYGRDALRRRLFRTAGSRLCDAMLDVVSGRRTYAEQIGTPLGFWRRLRAATRPDRGAVAEM